MQIVEDTAAQNIGMVCGYMLTEAVREWLVENNVTQIDNSMHASMMRRMDKKEKNDKQELVDSDSRTDDSAVSTFLLDFKCHSEKALFSV